VRFLLDTCVLLWYFEGSERIPVTLQDSLTDPANEVFASDVSALEIVFKHSLGKLILPGQPSALLPRLVEEHLIEDLPLSREAIFRLESLPHRHRDPFDRLLIAQALVHDMQLVTPDPLIRQYDVNTTWTR
jgi:PIN domain nuclease of toxin-antitoxin system